MCRRDGRCRSRLQPWGCALGGNTPPASALVNPAVNISTNIQFEPLNSSGSNAAAAPDFSMTTEEVMPVTEIMRAQAWLDGCLYNQETGEHPQFYFSHMLQTGDPYLLAREIRNGLDRTAAK